MDDIVTGKVDALDQDFPRTMAHHITELEPFVEELVRQQNAAVVEQLHISLHKGWISYQTATDHPDNLSPDDIGNLLVEKQAALQLHEDIHLLQKNTVRLTESGNTTHG